MGSIHSTIGHGQEFWDAMPIDFTRGWGVRWRRLQFLYDYAVEFYWMFIGLRKKDKEEKFFSSSVQSQTGNNIRYYSFYKFNVFIIPGSFMARSAAMLLEATSPFFLFLDVSLTSQVASTF